MTSTGPKELFISYGRELEVTAFVTKLKRDLEDNGFSVWLDLQDIPAGSDWHGAIGGGLYQCQAVLAVITNKYVSSTYCIKELYTADGDRKHIFPLMFEDVDLDKDQGTQGVKFTISSINWTMCRPGKDDYNTSISKLIQALRAKGLGEPNYSGRKAAVQLGRSIPAEDVGPKNTSEPVLVIPDTEMIGGIATGAGGEIVFTSRVKHSITVYQGEEERTVFGSMGVLGDHELLSPAGVAVTSEGEVVVACQYYLKKFTLDGKFISKTGNYASQDDPHTLQGPMGLAVGKGGRIYVVETAKNRVKIFNPDLTFHSSFSKGDQRLGPGHLNTPMGVATNSRGEVFVADLRNNVIQVFSPEGEFLFRFGKQGHTLGCIQSPMTLAIDTADYVYVASGTGVISIFKIQNSEAEFVKAFGSHGAELGQFSAICTMHIDSDSRLHVGEMTNNRIQVFK